ncbi:hypothetical protein [Halobacterium salinarum]|uniref:hypothetical protein n=1 Tax=Halobacterium salinarum TaxID=2242 RepID=UPI001F2AD78F|nr:hypothetical protein [Halobacterium salinarum]MCF2165437.1 hypothetical protein [Halobacterium salinarum]MCF2168302.1 hypothetical protein [Halobacterium salinarum]
MPQTTYERRPWVSAGRLVESTVPAKLAAALELEGGQPAAFAPFVDGTELAWRVTVDETVDADASNVRNIKHRPATDDASEQHTLRVPVVLAAMSGLTRLIKGESATLTYKEAAAGFRFTMWPPLHPWTPPTDEPFLDVPTTTSQLVELPDVYYVEVPTEQARALELAAGDAVAWRLTIRDGAVAVVADCDVDAVEVDAPHVRRVQSHMSGAEGREIEQFRLYIPAAAVDALGWQDADLRVAVEHNRLVLSRPSAGIKE